jgi:menaquinone-dependent protoporphyrinogen oxidase
MRVLVTAASRHGATTEIADAIGRTLRESLPAVDVRDPEAVTALDGYGAVVLGSAVYMGRWLEPARQLAERRRADLLLVPVWLFSSGPVGDPPLPAEEPPEVADLVREVEAREHRVFAGRLERRRLGLTERLMVSALRAPDGDFRDWPQIEEWARAIGTDLASRHPTRAGH